LFLIKILTNIHLLSHDCVVQEAEARGEDFNRVKYLDTPAEEADKIGRKKKNANPDQGFAGL
jgi:hypothetical protein